MHRQALIYRGASVSRVQFALNVSKLEDAINFHSKLFATEPVKVRTGCANLAIADPPLKLVPIDGHGDQGTRSTTSVSRSRPPRRRPISVSVAESVRR